MCEKIGDKIYMNHLMAPNGKKDGGGQTCSVCSDLNRLRCVMKILVRKSPPFVLNDSCSRLS